MISASEDFVFVAGGKFREHTNKTELLNLDSWKWEERRDYPYQEYTYWATSIYFNGQFIIFGGDVEINSRKRIDSYTPATDEWSALGQMKSARLYGHGLFILQNDIFVVGGYIRAPDETRSEKCVFSGKSLNCTYHTLPLINSRKNIII